MLVSYYTKKEERYCTKYNITPLIYMNDISEFKFT